VPLPAHHPTEVNEGYEGETQFQTNDRKEREVVNEEDPTRHYAKRVKGETKGEQTLNTMLQCAGGRQIIYSIVESP